MSSVTSPSMRASSLRLHQSTRIRAPLVKMEVKREVGLKAGLGSILYFGKRPVIARLVRKKSEQESIARGVDQVVALFLFLRVFF